MSAGGTNVDCNGDVAARVGSHVPFRGAERLVTDRARMTSRCLARIAETRPAVTCIFLGEVPFGPSLATERARDLRRRTAEAVFARQGCGAVGAERIWRECHFLADVARPMTGVQGGRKARRARRGAEEDGVARIALCVLFRGVVVLVTRGALVARSVFPRVAETR